MLGQDQESRMLRPHPIFLVARKTQKINLRHLLLLQVYLEVPQLVPRLLDLVNKKLLNNLKAFHLKVPISSEANRISHLLQHRRNSLYCWILRMPRLQSLTYFQLSQTFPLPNLLSLNWMLKQSLKFQCSAVGLLLLFSKNLQKNKRLQLHLGPLRNCQHQALRVVSLVQRVVIKRSLKRASHRSLVEELNLQYRLGKQNPICLEVEVK